MVGLFLCCPLNSICVFPCQLDASLHTRQDSRSQLKCQSTLELKSNEKRPSVSTLPIAQFTFSCFPFECVFHRDICIRTIHRQRTGNKSKQQWWENDSSCFLFNNVSSFLDMFRNYGPQSTVHGIEVSCNLVKRNSTSEDGNFTSMDFIIFFNIFLLFLHENILRKSN